MATFTNGGTVWAGFTWPNGDCVACATVSWDDNFYVTISDPTFSYADGSYLSASCKWRVRLKSGGSELAGTDTKRSSFQASEGSAYVFQACIEGPYPWGNSTKPEGTEGSSYFTVTKTYTPPPDTPDTPDTYSIQYNANGGTGAPPSQIKTEGEVAYLSYIEPTKSDVYEDPYIVTLDVNGGECSVGSLSADRIKYFIFGYWNTKPDGSGTTYHPGGSYSYDAPLTLYAIYLDDIVTRSVELPTPTRGGYEFLGWAANANDTSGVTGMYEPGGDITLFAIWKADGLLYIYDGESFSAFQAYIYDGYSWDLYCPYVYDSGWSMCS